MNHSMSVHQLPPSWPSWICPKKFCKEDRTHLITYMLSFWPGKNKILTGQWTCINWIKIFCSASETVFGCYKHITELKNSYGDFNRNLFFPKKFIWIWYMMSYMRNITLKLNAFLIFSVKLFTLFEYYITWILCALHMKSYKKPISVPYLHTGFYHQRSDGAIF